MPKATVKNLEAAFPGKGAELHALIIGKSYTRDYSSVREWEARSYNPLPYLDRVLCAANQIAETHGVECIRRANDDGLGLPDYECLNTGDSYALTLVRDYRRNTWIVAAWADLVERGGNRYA